MAGKSGASGKKSSAKKKADPGKVGSDPIAAKNFGGKNDFGIPEQQAQPGQETVIDGSLEDRPLGTRMPPADPDGQRTVGVGAPDSGPGSGSGGDLDPDFTGVGSGGAGIAAKPERAGERHTQGPDVIESPKDQFNFGGPAKGENELPPGTHGGTAEIKGSVNDRLDREVRAGESPSDDAVPHEPPDATSSSGFSRSSGEDVDDREASTGSD